MENTTNSTNGTFNGTFDGNGTFEGFQPLPPKPFWSGLLLPVVYLTILIGSLATFSSLYRKRKLARAAKLEPWFPPNRQRDIYLSLLHMDPAEASEGGDGEKKLSRVPDSLLKAALLQRAVEDIQRLMLLRNQKAALQQLLQRGSVGDELWQRFLRAEAEMQEEAKDVVTEANAFVPNWGQVIFQSANEILMNKLMKERMTEIQGQVESEKSWWEKKRTDIQTDFMKELEVEEKPPDTPQKKGNSDDDAVLVEAGGPAQTQGGSGKKKGKK